MLYGLPILGSIIGYYFGRVPAERRAETAEQSRDKTQEAADEATRAAAKSRQQAETSAAKADLAKTAMAEVRKTLSGGGDPASGDVCVHRVAEEGGGGAANTSTVIAIAQLDTALRLL